MSFFSSSFLVCSIILFTTATPAVAILSILSMFLIILAGVILLFPPPPFPPPFGSGSPPYSRLGALSGLIYSLLAISTLFSLGLSSGSNSSLSKMP
jgi:hypothetical protein